MIPFLTNVKTRPDPRYDDPRTSTTAQRKNFTDTELFNNQDLYSSKRHQTASSNSTSMSYSSSSTSESTSVRKSASSSIVNSTLNRSTSSTRVSALASTERRSSTRTEEVGGVNTTLSKNTASIVAKVLANNKDVANAHVNGTAINGNAVDDEKLPCEFCEAMIPMYKLHSHQVVFGWYLAQYYNLTSPGRMCEQLQRERGKQQPHVVLFSLLQPWPHLLNEGDKSDKRGEQDRPGQERHLVQSEQLSTSVVDGSHPHGVGDPSLGQRWNSQSEGLAY